MTYEEIKKRYLFLLDLSTPNYEQRTEERKLAKLILKRVSELETEVSDLSVLVEARR